jgi:hypothetical protein
VPAITIPIGPIFFGDARRRRFGKSGVNGGFAASLLCASLRKQSRSDFLAKTPWRQITASLTLILAQLDTAVDG